MSIHTDMAYSQAAKRRAFERRASRMPMACEKMDLFAASIAGRILAYGSTGIVVIVLGTLTVMGWW